MEQSEDRYYSPQEWMISEDDFKRKSQKAPRRASKQLQASLTLANVHQEDSAQQWCTWQGFKEKATAQHILFEVRAKEDYFRLWRKKNTSTRFLSHM